MPPDPSMVAAPCVRAPFAFITSVSLDLNLLCIAMCSRAVRFDNCLVELDVASVYRGVLRQNIDDALSTRSRAHNFVGVLFQVLRLLLILPRAAGLSRTLQSCLPLDATAIDEALSTRYTEHTPASVPG